MKKILFSLVAILGLGFASCNKDTTDDALPSTPQPPASGVTVTAPKSLTYNVTTPARGTNAITYAYTYTNNKPTSVKVTGGENPYTATFSWVDNMLQSITVNGVTETFTYEGTTIVATIDGQSSRTLTLNGEQVANDGTSTYTYDGASNMITITGGEWATTQNITYEGVNYFAKLNLLSYQAFLLAPYLVRDTHSKSLVSNPLEEVYTNGDTYSSTYTLASNGMPETTTTTAVIGGVTTITNITPDYNNPPQPGTPPTEEGAGDGKAILLKETKLVKNGEPVGYIRYKYDSQNRLVFQDLVDEYSLTFGYDSQNRLSTVIFNDYVDGETRTTNYTYNGNEVTDGYTIYTLDVNNRISIIEYDYTTSRYNYDEKGRVSSIEAKNNDSEEFIPVAYGYIYDNMNSPFKNVSVKQLFFIPDLGFFNQDDGTYINNIEHSDGTGGITTYNYNGNYSSAGFPLEAQMLHIENDGEELSTTIIYTYYNE